MPELDSITISLTNGTSKLTTDTGTKLWEDTLGALSGEVDEENFNTWLRTAHFRSMENSTLHLDVPSAFNLSWLRRNYQERITNTIERIAERHIEVDFHVSPQTEDDLNSDCDSDPSTPPTTQNTSPAKVTPAHEPARLDKTGVSPSLTFEKFVVGESNRFAHAACRAVAEPETEAWNPLLIWGGSGLGKTHLLHATGRSFLQASPASRVCYVGAEQFMNGFIQAIQQGKITAFREMYRSVDLLLLDDVQFIFGKEGTQNEFFHTFNELRSRDKKIVLSCDRPPSEMSNIEERLRSRFEWGLIVDVQAPDLETRMAILKQKAIMFGVDLTDDVALFIAERIKTNIRKLEGVLSSLCHHWRLTGKPIGMESVQQVLGHFVVSNEPQRVTVERIQACVCNYFSISHADLVGRERHKKITLPRHLAMYLARLLTDLSLPEIAQYFNGRNHTTILHAYRKITKELPGNTDMQNVTNYLAKMIQESAE